MLNINTMLSFYAWAPKTLAFVFYKKELKEYQYQCEVIVRRVQNSGSQKKMYFEYQRQIHPINDSYQEIKSSHIIYDLKDHPLEYEYAEKILKEHEVIINKAIEMQIKFSSVLSVAKLYELEPELYMNLIPNSSINKMLISAPIIYSASGDEKDYYHYTQFEHLTTTQQLAVKEIKQLTKDFYDYYLAQEILRV